MQQHPPLLALVLAGGESKRMRSDKGAIDYGGGAQAARLHEMLAEHCERAFVSIRPSQALRRPYADLPTVVDVLTNRGPASGLLAAGEIEPQAAWLAVAVDLARLDEETIAALIRARNPSAAATAYAHPHGTLEPLCTIWEPRGLELLAARVAAGETSPRHCLETADVEILECARPEALLSFDAPAERDALLAQRSPTC